MTLRAEKKWISWGGLVALVGTIICGNLATSESWSYGLVAALLIPIWIFVSRQRAKAEERGNLEALQNIFRESDHGIPILLSSGRYGYPVLTLIFSSKAGLDAAEIAGLVAAFKAFVENLYADIGSKANPFDVERAVNATCENANWA